MDACAVSICKGLSVGRVSPRHAVTAGLWFGGFQALMPFLGWLLGTRFQSFITSIDHWIAFVLLGLIGLNMIREALGGGEEGEMDTSFAPSAMFPPGGGHQHRRPGGGGHLRLPQRAHRPRPWASSGW